MQRSESSPTSAEPVEPCAEEVYSSPPPYSSLPVLSYHPGNGHGFNNSHGQGSRNIYKQSSIPEMSNQDNLEVFLTEGKATLLFLQALIEN